MRHYAPIAALLTITAGLLLPASWAQQTNAPGGAVTNTAPPLFDAALTNSAVGTAASASTNTAPVTATNTATAVSTNTIVPASPDTSTNSAPPASTGAPILAPAPDSSPVTPFTPLIQSPQGPPTLTNAASVASTALVIDTSVAASSPPTPVVSPVIPPATVNTNTVTAPQANSPFSALPNTATNTAGVAGSSTLTNTLIVTPSTNSVVISTTTNAPPATNMASTNSVATTTPATANPPSNPAETNVALQPFIQSPQVLLSDDGYNLIVYYESGGESYFIHSGQQYPTWPQGDSGVTVGIGVDLGYTLSSRVISDWTGRLPDPEPVRLSQVAGLTGSSAKNAVKQVHDILVNWDISVDEFKNVEVPDEVSLTKQVFPGADELRINALSALVATVYNRGTSLTGSSRVDMRTIRQLVETKDYEGMAEALEHMIVTMGPAWKSEGVYAGLRERYLATAQLMRTP